ncbi:hypothetical protein C0993_012251 [Termitomyces sp. T159_Od127]|nr:hypothetical protein C0993_012251 [Termitomyces sp. T159_Od127]
MVKGTKRASPGADAEKNPLTEVELSDEDAEKLRISQRQIARVELVLGLLPFYALFVSYTDLSPHSDRITQKKLVPAYEKRREIVKTIPKFWPVALMNHSLFAYHVQHSADQLALSYLEDLWVERDPAEPRCYTIEFTFKENPYFTDRVLKKEFKYVPPPAAANEKPDEDGITDSMLEFSWDRDVVASGQKINWKDADKALTKLYPRETAEDDEVADPGSFFNFFEHDSDPFEVSSSPSRLASVASVSLLAAAHVEHPAGLRKAHRRQVPTVTSIPSPVAAGTTTPLGTSVSVAPHVSGVPTVPVSGSVTGVISAATSLNSTTPTTTFTFSLAATNPTAAPLSDIVSTAASSATVPLPTTFAPGSTPTVVSGAPVLPNAAILSPANYPALDRVPPTDSDLVKQWIEEVQSTGVTIPDYSPTSPGGCPNNTAAAADGDRCWWTCGGCTRQTDITECPTAMTWGLTYDDGPAFYTPNLLTYLDQVNLKSTFFVVGSRVISFPAILQNEYMSGHQIAVHTWSHPPLTTLTNEQIIAELGWSKKVIKDVLGVTPNMMRPPYGDIEYVPFIS